MNIVALKYGESVFSEDCIFKGGNKNKHLPISFTIYLIQTENRNILVDVGCDDGAGFHMTLFKKPVDVLREYGLSPNDITDVILTHSHHDHIEAIRYYHNATIHIQREEYTAAAQYIPTSFAVHLFEGTFSLTENVMIQKIGGHTIGSCIVLADCYVLCGDECYYATSLTDKICTGVSCNEAASQAFIEEFSKEIYRPLLFHDPGTMPGCVGYMRIE